MRFTIYNLRFAPRSSRRKEALTNLRFTCRSAGGPVPQTSKPASRSYSDGLPIWKSAIQQVWKPAVRVRLQSAFTLIEMLTVIAIIGIIAGLSVPVIKNFGQSNVTVSASRQLRDDVGRARQLAMSERTTVYMVFLPTNFWNVGGLGFPNTWYNKLTPPQLSAFSNLLDKQLSGYTFMAQGAVGDQPTVGQKTWHYLAPWQSLPQGSFIPLWKFYDPAGGSGGQQALSFNDPANPNFTFNINPFSYTNIFPFPTEDSTNTAGNLPYLPYIAFNYLGQLSDYYGNMLTSANQGQDYDLDFAGGGVDIPLAQGSVIPTKDPTSRAPVPMAGSPGVIASPGVTEMPPGNSTNISYEIVHIDPLTGRATLEYHKMQ
jgi:prepilin-type N-terminal cleavage/methylation domain-containing protein